MPQSFPSFVGIDCRTKDGISVNNSLLVDVSYAKIG